MEKSCPFQDFKDREADIVAVGGVQVPVMGEENEREITIEELERALNEAKGSKAPGMDGVRVEMLKEGGCDCIGMVGEIV